MIRRAAPSVSARSRMIFSPKCPGATLLGSKPCPSSLIRSSICIGPTAEPHGYLAGVGVASHVVQRFLRDPIHRNLYIGRQNTLPIERHRDRHARPAADRLGQQAQ